MTYLLRRFYRDYLRPNFRVYLPVQILHVVGAALGLAPPLLFRDLIDKAIPAKNFKSIIYLSLWTLGIFLSIAIIRFLKNYWGHKVAQKIVFDMRNELYKHFQALPMRFHDNKKTGELMSRVIDDLNLLQEFVHHGPEGLLTAGTNIVGVLIILFLFNVPLTLIALSFAPLLAIYAYMLVQKMFKAFRKNRIAKAQLNDRLEDSLAGIKVIKAFANEDFELDRFSQKNKNHYEARSGAIKYLSMLGPGAYLFNSIGLVLTIGYGGYLVAEGFVTAGTIVAFYTYLLRFRAPVLRLIRISQRLSRFFASMERYFDHLDIEPDISSKPGAFKKDGKKIKGRISYQHVYFTYQRGERVLEDINLKVAPEQTVALVGPSGAGKTTIVRLLPRLYETDKGAIKIDGIDIRDWNVNDLRNSISMVMQDDYLFSGTIRENITYGRPDAGKDQIIKVAKEANVHEFARQLPDGYQTEVGQRGVKLSGGQKQRISIARALLKDPEILILDEATSSVDSYTEKLIQEAIERVTRGRTTFIIAHRLSTITGADKILFVENGRIMERGSYQELMDRGGRFCEFYELQFEEVTVQ